MSKLLINHNREKLFNLITFFVKNTRNCGETKLFKLLYYADFRHVKETGKSITGLKYFAWERGPFPKKLYYEIKNPPEDFKKFFSTFQVPRDEYTILKIVPKEKFNEGIFTKREMKIIKELIEVFGPVPGNMMVKCTHLANDPWDIVFKKGEGKGEYIDYILALDTSKDSITEAEYKEKQKEIEMLRSLFNEE